ncbi:hypothetical protein HN587_02010 [Candidatus Woesearchaeota archaeon]|jgi:hypothetical protein|nr:hypothetical protein [Candidatus Woesearchaeota archaeon]
MVDLEQMIQNEIQGRDVPIKELGKVQATVKDITNRLGRSWNRFEKTVFFRYGIAGQMPWDYQKKYHEKHFGGDFEREVDRTFRIAPYVEIGFAIPLFVGSMFAGPLLELIGKMAYWGMYMEGFAGRRALQLKISRRKPEVKALGSAIVSAPYHAYQYIKKGFQKANEFIDSKVDSVIHSPHYKSLNYYCAQLKKGKDAIMKGDFILSNYLSKIVSEDSSKIIFYLNEIRKDTPNKLNKLYSLTIASLKTQKNKIMKNKRATAAHSRLKNYFNDLLEGSTNNLAHSYQVFINQVSRRRDTFL